MSVTLPVVGSSGWGPPLNSVLSTFAETALNPGDLGYLTWNFPSWHAIAFTGTAPASGTVVMMRLPQLTRAVTVNGTYLYRASAASGLTGAYTGLYTSAGTQVAVSANTSGAWGAIGVQQTAFTAPYAAAAGAQLYVAMLFVGTTPPQIAAAQNANHQSLINGATTAATAVWATGPTGQTTLPASITMASRTPHTTSHWAGLY